MRTIGNIERFLVIGIVVVIGAILAVAIKGADDLDGAYKKQVAKANEGRKPGGTPLNRTDPMRGPSSAPAPAPAKSERADKGADRTDTDALSKTLQNLLDQRRNGEAGKTDGANSPSGTIEKPDPSKSDPAAPPAGGELGGASPKPDADTPAPVVIKDDPKSPPESKDAGGATPPNGRSGVESKTNPPASQGLDWTYEVQPGDRLERVASTLYGEKSMWKDILAANPEYPDATRIRAGAVLVLPKPPVNTTATGLAHGSAKATGATPADGHHDAKTADAARAPQPADGTKATSYKRVTSSDKYEVQKGDTLMAIAAAHYGTRAAWRMILVANADSIPDKDHIKPGTVLKLPAE